MKKFLSFVLLLVILLSSSCNSPANTIDTTSTTEALNTTSATNIVNIEDKYKNFYEIFVHSFYDSNGDKIGDLNGVTEKLDYLNDGKDNTNSLGINAIYLMPIMPSPSYHKYDVTDYYNIDPEYGTLADFDKLIAECHKRGIAVIMDLVLNHTSAQHPWFLSAKKSIETGDLNNPYRNYYNFSQEPGPGKTNVGMPPGWYYEAVFWDQMPDLNLDNEAVRNDIKDITKFWLDKGVDGFRLDAVLHYYENATAKNIDFLNWFDEMAKSINKDVYIVGEAWSDQLTIANYYKSTIDSFFNFPFSGIDGFIKKSLSSQNGYTLSKQIFGWQTIVSQRNPNAIDAPFISNHDNDRSIGYFPDIATAKLAASIYLLMPGNPYIYYGEEIGMTGNGKDENKRQPLVWSVTDKTGIPAPVSGTEQTQNLTAGIDEQLKDPNSLLSHYRNILKIKSENPEIARGKLTVIDPKIKEICFYSAEYNGSTVYIIHNLSDKSIDIPLPDGVNPAKIVGALYTSGGESQLNGSTITIAQKSTLVLK